jgi:hypothetical protein
LKDGTNRQIRFGGDGDIPDTRCDLTAAVAEVLFEEEGKREMTFMGSENQQHSLALSRLEKMNVSHSMELSFALKPIW